MSQIEETKKQNPHDKDVSRVNDPSQKPKTMSNDKTITADLQMKYPLMKPIAFTNPTEDDYLAGGVWNLKN